MLGVLQPMFTSAVFAALLLAWSLAHHKWIATAKVKFTASRLKILKPSPLMDLSSDELHVSDPLPAEDEPVTAVTRQAIDDDFGRYCHILMLLEALALGAATCTYSTELLGVFFAGFAFSTRPEVRHEFEVKSLPVMKWLGMAFFASLGFSVPLDAMLSWKMWFSGLLMTAPSGDYRTPAATALFPGMLLERLLVATSVWEALHRHVFYARPGEV